MNMQVMDPDVRKLKRIKISLMRNAKFAFWSGIMMVGKTVVDDNLPTAATNGRDEFYGRKFIQSTDDKELAYGVLHENGHKICRHLTTYKKLHDEDHKLANMACDYVLNLWLFKMDPTEQFIAPPRRDGKIYILLDKRFDNMTVKQVFDILKKEKQEGGSRDEGGDDSFDEHDWESATDMSDEEKKDLEREINRAIRQGQYAAKRAGTGSADMDIMFGELLAPKVDWRAELHDFVRSICSGRDSLSSRRHHRRYVWQDMFLPSLISERIGEIVVGADMSGSCVSQITPFLSEIKGLAGDVSPEKLHLLYWDTKVVSHETYEGHEVDNLTDSTKPKGGGGTDPRCVLNYMKQHNIKPECVIMLTDGEVGGDWGDDWGVPVLWVIVGNKNIVSPVGKTIHMEG